MTGTLKLGWVFRQKERIEITMKKTKKIRLDEKRFNFLFYFLVLGTFLKHFPKDDFPSDNFPSGKFPNAQFP